MDVLAAAISRAEQAVAATPENHPNRAIVLNNLGIYLIRRYEQTGSIDDLAAAIVRAEQAVKATLDDIPKHVILLNKLGLYLNRRYERTKSMDDLTAAIARTEQAVEATPEDHPDYAMFLNTLGLHLSRRYKQTGSMDDVRELCKILLAAWNCCTASFSQRFHAVSVLAKISFESLRTIVGLKQLQRVLTESINAISMTSHRSLSHDDQQHILQRITGLTAFAASVTLEAGGTPYEALELIEIGRCVSNGYQLDYRSDTSRLTDQHPKIASKFSNICAQMESSPTNNNDNSAIYADEESHNSRQVQALINQQKFQERKRLADELSQTLDEIRRLPGFNRFLRLPGEQELSQVASHGPIVVVNVTKLRGDAIIVTSTSIKTLHLCNLTFDEAFTNLNAMQEGILRSSSSPHYFGETNRKMENQLLPWLWKTVVRPVLKVLEFLNDAMAANPQHIWWIGVDIMATAPFHAAGDYSSQRQWKRSTLTYCIPSYTPTIRALIYSRQASQRWSKAQASVAIKKPPLIILMPTTPGQGQLNVKPEQKILEQAFAACQVLHRPTASEVLQQMPNHDIVHFACHGSSHASDPTKSHLTLVRINENSGKEEADELYVRDIAALKMSSAQLVYLSACSTAEMRSDAGPIDEVIHIASSFQIAGFSHVIGTLWTTADDACIKMSSQFYQKSVTGHDLLVEDIARAYRESILELRKMSIGPITWGPFIHMGA